MTGRLFLWDTQGTTAVEFALTAPLFFLLLFGIAQIGMWLWATSALQHGAEAAARCASVTPSTCSTAASVQQFAVNNSYGLNVSAKAFTVNMAATCGNPTPSSAPAPSSQGEDDQGGSQATSNPAPSNPVQGYQVTASMPYFEFLTDLHMGTYIATAAACFPK